MASILSLADHLDHEGARDVIQNVVTECIRLTLNFLQSEHKSTNGFEAFFKKQSKQIHTYPKTLHLAEHIPQLMKKSA